MHEYAHLDHTAEHTLHEDASWEAARHLGKYLVKHMRSDGSSSTDRHYYMDADDIGQQLYGVSEQPDLTGAIGVHLHRGEGIWLLSRPQTNSYHELRSITARTGSYVGLTVNHIASQENLLQVALPLTPLTGHMLRNGYATSYTMGTHQRGILDRYNGNDLSFNPRRVLAAAYISRHIIGQNIPHESPTRQTPEQNLAWLEEYMPYQDLPLTGGGGKTVRRRYPYDGKRKTYTLEELHAMRRPRDSKK